MGISHKKSAPTGLGMSEEDKYALLFLGNRSRGCKLDPGQRLIALAMLHWRDDWDRDSMAPDEIADMVSMTPSQVLSYLESMSVYCIVKPMADGWVLTLDEFRRHSRQYWYDRPALPANHS